MRTARKGFLLSFILLMFPCLICSADNFLHHSIQATILVADADQAADLIARWADDSGGYILFKSSDAVVIRFPFTEIGKLRAFLENLSELVIEISPQAVDLREEIPGIQSGIRSREEILQKNLSFIDRADIAGTLAIEKEIILLIEEIEGLKGRLNKLNVDRKFARAEIYLKFMEQSLPEDIPSSFDWINTVDFYSFMREGF